MELSAPDGTMSDVSISSERFRMPDGAQLVGRQGDVFQMRVSIPCDEDGFLGRECPDVPRFRVDSGDYEALPEDLNLWCVYCGHHDDHDEFMTRQQRDRLMRAVGDLGEQLAQKIPDDAFGRWPRSTHRSGSGIQATYRSEPFFPRPLPGISEECLAAYGNARLAICATRCSVSIGTVRCAVRCRPVLWHQTR